MIDLTLEIVERLAKFTEDVKEDLLQVADQVTAEAITVLKRTSPKHKNKYAKSWTRKKTANGYVIHNKKYYLTHLLEHGHAKRGGGRVEGFKHISPVEQETVRTFEQKIWEALQ